MSTGPLSAARLAYPAQYQAAGVGYVVTFRDLPIAITRGETLRDAREMAADALTGAVQFHVDTYRPVPEPSAALPGEEPVYLTQDLSVLVVALNEAIALGVNEQVFRRLTA